MPQVNYRSLTPMKFPVRLSLLPSAFLLICYLANATPSSVPDATRAARWQRMQQAAQADWSATMASLGLSTPTLPPPQSDPKRPPHTTRVPGSPYNWTDGVPGHTIVRSSWGNWNNYDEARADRYPLPALLRTNDGRRVDTPDLWWKVRRPELLEEFASQIYGRIPSRTPAVTWRADAPAKASDGSVTTHWTGLIDNRAYPRATPQIDLSLTLPPGRRGPVPVIVVIDGGFHFPGYHPPPGPTPRDLVLARGWAYAVFTTEPLQQDSGAGLRAGIIGLVNCGAARKPDDWGVLAAWSWGLSRSADLLQRLPAIDGHALGLEGHSRWGKAALLAAALDSRWTAVYSSCSGECGAKLHRHDVGESVDNVCGPSEYHWMAGNFLKYAGHWDRLPVDQHELIALVAPRALLVTGGTEDQWSDPVGEFQACVAASPVYRLLGFKGLDTDTMPAPDAGLMSGDLAFRLHRGGHTDLPDWPAFLKFAARHFSTGTPASGH